MTWEQFREIFAVLALQLRATDADEPMARSYLASLNDLEPELVAMAAQRMAREGGSADGSHWFPKTSEWRELVAKIERERTDDLKARLRKRPTPLCLACNDTSFELDAEANRVKPCACRKQRRLEVLGRRPMPELPSGEPSGDQTQIARVEQAAGELANQKGWR